MLAVVIGETGDLGLYANPAKVWKRLGLAPAPAYKMIDGSGKEAVAKPRERRARIWVIGDLLVKGNGEGPYRSFYLARKAELAAAHPDWTKMKVHRCSQQQMEKRLIVDLWCAWTGNKARHNGESNRAMVPLAPIQHVPD
jgi:hypothetical protein